MLPMWALLGPRGDHRMVVWRGVNEGRCRGWLGMQMCSGHVVRKKAVSGERRQWARELGSPPVFLPETMRILGAGLNVGQGSLLENCHMEYG